MRKYKTLRCKILPDLIQQNLSIPIKHDDIEKYIFQTNSFQYRHYMGEFQIRYVRQWWNANSIDFEFLNSEVK